MTSTRITYHLTALEDFRCLAGDCPASCCAGWQIQVEPELIQRWAALPDEHDRSLFRSVVREGRDATFFMTGSDNPRCGLLTAEGLCRAHARYGVEYTPRTCRDFPRMQEETPLHRVESGSPACPVIARRLVAGAPVTSPYTRQAPPADAWDHDTADTRYRLTELLDEVMALNHYPIGLRLYYLAGLVSGLPASGPDRSGSAPEAMLRDLTERVGQPALQPDPFVAGSFWNTLYHLGHSRGLLPEPPAAGSALRAGLRGLPNDRRSFYAAVYAEIRGYREPAMPVLHRDFGHALNRLLHVYLMNTGFPWQPSLGDYRLSFVHAVLLFALTELRLWMLAAAGDRLDAGS